MPLRNELAVTRTNLANQRTLLMFFNASLALFIAGLTLIKFFPGEAFFWLGLAFMPSAAVVLLLGIVNYLRCKKKIIASYQNFKDPEPPAAM